MMSGSTAVVLYMVWMSLSLLTPDTVRCQNTQSKMTAPAADVNDWVPQVTVYPYNINACTGAGYKLNYRQGTCNCFGQRCFRFFCTDTNGGIYVEMYVDSPTHVCTEATVVDFFGNHFDISYSANSCILPSSFYGDVVPAAAVQVSCVPPSQLQTLTAPTNTPAQTALVQNQVIQVQLFESTNTCGVGPVASTIYIPQNTCYNPYPGSVLSTTTRCLGLYSNPTLGGFTQTSIALAVFSDQTCFYAATQYAPGAIPNSACMVWLTALNSVYYIGSVMPSVKYTCVDPPMLPTPPAIYANYYVQATFYAYTGGCSGSSAVVSGPLYVSQGVCFTDSSSSTSKSYKAVCDSASTVYLIPYSDSSCRFIYGAVGDVSTSSCIQSDTATGMLVQCVANPSLNVSPIPTLPGAQSADPTPAVPSPYGAFLIHYTVTTSSYQTGFVTGTPAVQSTVPQPQCVLLDFTPYALTNTPPASTTLIKYSMRLQFAANGGFVVRLYSDTLCGVYVSEFTAAPGASSTFNNAVQTLVLTSVTAPTSPAIPSGVYANYMVLVQPIASQDGACSTSIAPETVQSQGVCVVSTAPTALALFCDETGNVTYRQMASDCTTFFAQGQALNDACVFIPASNTRYRFACSTLTNGVLPQLANTSVFVVPTQVYLGSSGGGSGGKQLSTLYVVIIVVSVALGLLAIPIAYLIYKHRGRKSEARPSVFNTTRVNISAQKQKFARFFSRNAPQPLAPHNVITP